MTSAKRLRVLVVDENQIVADTVAEMATAKGHYAVPASITSDIDEVLQTTACDVVIFDVELLPPGGSVDCLTSLRHRYPAVKIVGTSSTQRRATRNLRLDSFLGKPFALNQLDAVLSDITS